MMRHMMIRRRLDTLAAAGPVRHPRVLTPEDAALEGRQVLR